VEKIALFTERVMNRVQSVDAADLDRFFHKLLVAFRQREVSYDVRASIIRSFNAIAEPRATRNHDQFWTCLDIFLAWCEAAADVSTDYPPDLRLMLEALLDVWSQLLTKIGKDDVAVVHRVANVAPTLLALIARTWDRSAQRHLPFDTWSLMMRRFERKPCTDDFQSVAGSVRELHPVLSKSLEELRRFKWQCTAGECAKDFAVLIPLLEGRDPAPERHVPRPYSPISCDVFVDGQWLDAEVIELCVERHCGLVVRCHRLQLEPRGAYDKEGDKTKRAMRGFVLRQASARSAADRNYQSIVEMEIRFPEGAPFGQFRGQFGVIRAWPSDVFDQGSEWALVAADDVTPPLEFNTYVKNLPKGRHRPKQPLHKRAEPST